MKSKSQLIQKIVFIALFLVAMPLAAGSAEENGVITKDPFVDPTAPPPPGVTKGLENMRIGEVGLIGVAKLQEERLAFIRGTDNRGYTMREGDRLEDGMLVRIDIAAGEAIFHKDIPPSVTSAGSLEVRKQLHVK